MVASSTAQRRFHVGENVRFTFGTLPVTGEVVEDRGPLGGGGRQIVRVRLDMDPYDPLFFELPADELEVWQQPDAPLSPDEIREYLSNGGLLLMLQTGPNDREPRIWLRRDHLGNVTHTFIEKRGMVGGAVPPGLAVEGDRIFSGKRDAVQAFIRSFGLTDRDADRIIRHIGVAPA